MSETIITDGGKKSKKLKLVVDNVPQFEPPTGPSADLLNLEKNPPEFPMSPDPAPKAFSERPVRKIAVCGSAISSVGLAPYQEKDWEIWSCSPANKGQPRVDVWFELHNPTVKEREGLTEWMNWLKEQPIVYMQKTYPGYKGARTYPLQQIIAKFGPFWWTSQLAYMLALAIEQNPQTIGIYGVDMAANSEYSQQRIACQFLIHYIIKHTEIELVVPPESDLLEHAPLYGYCESSRMWRKQHARELELRGRIASLKAEAQKAESQAVHLIGALDDMEYQTSHWANRLDFE